METNKKFISEKQIKPIKEACRLMYLESRTFQGTTYEQDKYLDILINESFKKSYNKAILNDPNLIEGLEECSDGFLLELKKLMGEWVEEFEKDLKIKTSKSDNNIKKWWCKYWKK